MNSLELKDKQAVLIKRCKDIVSVCKTEVREMTEEEKKEFDENKEEIKQLREQLDELNKRLASYDEELPEDAPEADEAEEQKNTTRNMKTRFNLLKELRNAYDKQEPLNLAEFREYSVSAEGEDVVVTDIFDIWEPLRAKSVLAEAGAKFITGIKNNIQIPLMDAVSVTFEGEKAAAKDGSAGFTSKKLSPKRITAKYPISLQLLAQDSIGVENAIRADIMRAIGSKLEEVVLGAEAGTTEKPAGLFYNKTMTNVATFEGITSLESDVEEANILGDCKYIVSPKAKGRLRNMPKSSKSTELVLEKNEIDGTPVLSTSHIKDYKMAYGDWSNLVVATWDNVTIDVVRDVQSVGNGVVTIVVNAFVDAQLIRDNAIVFAQAAEGAAGASVEGEE